MFKKESRSYRKIEMPGVEYGNTTVTELSILKCYASKKVCKQKRIHQNLMRILKNKSDQSYF